MVGREHEAESLCGIGGRILGDILFKVRHSFPALRDVIQQMVQFPGIRGVKGILMQFRSLAFRKEIYSRIVLPQLRKGLSPEIHRDFAGHVAPEPVHSLVQPEPHGIRHRGTHVLVVVIQLRDVRPVILRHRIAQGITDIPVSRLAGLPHGVRRGVVGHPVQYHFES